MEVKMEVNSLRSWKFLDQPSGKAERKWTLPYAISSSIVLHAVLNSLFNSHFNSLL